MSVFTVRLPRPAELGAGYVTDPAYNSVTGLSIQKTMEVNGPSLTRRRLTDGQTFTSTNYWKRFAPVSEGGGSPAETAIVHIVSDDGTPWSDSNPEVNKFARVISRTLTAGTTYSAANNQIDMIALYGAIATYTQITVDGAVTARLNSSSSAEMDLASGTHYFDNGDLPLVSLAFDNTASGAGDVALEVVMTLQIQSTD
jgi:hypothetical protein